MLNNGFGRIIRLIIPLNWCSPSWYSICVVVIFWKGELSIRQLYIGCTTFRGMLWRRLYKAIHVAHHSWQYRIILPWLRKLTLCRLDRSFFLGAIFVWQIFTIIFCIQIFQCLSNCIHQIGTYARTLNAMKLLIWIFKWQPNDFPHLKAIVYILN